MPRRNPGIPVYFTLVDQTLFAAVYEFNRILYRQNMPIPCIIDVINHGSEGGTFTGPRRSRYRYQSPWSFRDASEDGAQIEIFHGQHPGRNGSEYGAGATILIEYIGPEPGNTGYFKGKVTLVIRFIEFTLPVIHDFVNQFPYFLPAQDGQVDSPNITINTDHWRQSRGEVKIGPALFFTVCQ